MTRWEILRQTADTEPRDLEDYSIHNVKEERQFDTV